MTLFYYFSLLLLVRTKYLLAYPCYVCDSMYFNYLITIDDLPLPTREDCQTITADTGCFARVDWFNDQTSLVLYGTNLGWPLNSVTMRTDYRVNISSNYYSIHKYTAFICGTSDSMPCNTVEKLKLTIISTTLPMKEQIQQFNQLIVPTKVFDSSLCYEARNMTENCPETDLLDCQQCLIAVEHLQETSICATCPGEEPTFNFIMYDTTFLLNNQTRLDIISLGCQGSDACNSMKNIAAIKNTLMNKFDFNKFFYSTASNTKSSLILLLTALLILSK